MRSANLMLERRVVIVKSFCFLLGLFFFQILFAQDNSPYSRYGLGDIVPNTNIVNRAMGGISAGYNAPYSVNFNNPASYSGFLTTLEERSKRPLYGRVILDVGINIDTRTLQAPNQTEKFSSTGAQFSYLQLGIPIKPNWGISFGLRPVTRIGYKIANAGPILDGHTGNYIDSGITEFSGDGGSFLPSVGTGFKIKNFSIGANLGYLFGKKEYSSRIALFNDTVLYNPGNYVAQSSFGGLFLNGGIQYRVPLKNQTYLQLGASGNWKHKIDGSSDIRRETFTRGSSGQDFQLDSVYEQKNIKGEVIYPANYTIGFVVEHTGKNFDGWLFGVDFVQNKWSNYRFFGIADSVRDSWQVRVGGQFNPEPGRAYLSNVAYRGGFFFGPDYIKVGDDLPQFGVSLGLGLPLRNFNRLSPGQATIINLGFEYAKRGNNSNRLKENTFRIAIGLNFSDLWFAKRRYD